MLTETLQVSLSGGTVLVPTEVVRAVWGVDAETVAGKVETGELQWVFDVSVAKSRVRELRFWVRELLSSECARLTPPEAVERILGGRQRWNGAQIQQLLMTSRPGITRWHQSGDLAGERLGRTFWTSRKALAQFLLNRLCRPGPS